MRFAVAGVGWSPAPRRAVGARVWGAGLPVPISLPSGLPARSSKVLETYIKSSKRGFEGRVGVFLGENVRRCAHKSRVSLRVESGSAGVPRTAGGRGQREAGDSGRPRTAGGRGQWEAGDSGRLPRVAPSVGGVSGKAVLCSL